MKRLTYLLALIMMLSCNENSSYDLILTNAKVYTVDDQNEWVEAVAIKDGKIVALGNSADIGTEARQVLDCKGQFLMPGFIEGHGHFAGMGEMLLNLNFLRSKSWEQIVSQVEEKAKTTEKGAWIEGRGWHQEKWDSIDIRNVNGYPYHVELSKISPDNPVILYHASGHSLFANAKAMEEAGITKETAAPMGGLIVRDNDGTAIGVFEERAMNLISRAHQKYEQSLSSEELENKWYKGIQLAQNESLEKGITSYQDAGAKFEEHKKYEQLARENKLDIRLWSMVRHSSEDMKGKVGEYKKVGVGNNFYTCNAIKSELDGALGSFGAWLLEPYNDKKDFYGQNTTEIEELEAIAQIAKDNNMQLCIHAIGDKANRASLDVVEKFNGDNLNHRWRIEHSQHLHPDDIPRFKSTGTIASMQGIHCTSDAPFVEKRLGKKRAKEGAYPWRSLIDAGAIIANGTDAPVEDVDPIESFYASVTRKRIDNGFEFFPEQKMTRKEAIASYTINNAYAAFEENLKGSIEIGKLADFVLLSENLIECSDEEILDTKILMTIVDGVVKYKNTVN